jgi:DNA-3-methyladenine glycosylase
MDQIANGPAKLTKAMSITGNLNGVNLCEINSPLFIENNNQITIGEIRTSTRIGIEKTPEPWRSKPWRFFSEPVTLTKNR